MKKILSIGVLMFISVTFCALLIGYSAPISVDDDVGATIILVNDDFYQPLIQNQFIVNEQMWIQESRWNYPGTTYNVANVFGEVYHAEAYNLYYVNQAWSYPVFVEQIYTQPTRLYNLTNMEKNTMFKSFNWEVIGTGEFFSSSDVKW